MDTGVNSTATHSAASYNKDGIQGKDVHHTTSLDGEPAFPTTPVLSLELENISKLSKGGREGLSYMWSVFSRCRESIRDGRRLENLSWRLWYEDLKSTGCLASSPSSSQLSTLTESDSESDGDSNTFEDIQDNDNDAENARQDESEEKMKSSSSVSAMPAANASDAPAETAQRRRREKQEDGVKVKNPIATSEGGDMPTQSRVQRPSSSGNEAENSKSPKMTMQGSQEAMRNERRDSTSSSPSAAIIAQELASAISSPPRHPCAPPVSLPELERHHPVASTSAVTLDTPAEDDSNLQKSIRRKPLHQSSTSPSSRHTRRSSCPASRNRETLRVSSCGEDEHDAINAGSHHSRRSLDQQRANKEKRAMSFANAHRPHAHHGSSSNPFATSRVARAMPPLTPETIQDIIGTVLPMNFKDDFRIHTPSPVIPAHKPFNSPNSTTHRSAAATQTIINGNAALVPSPTVPDPVNRQQQEVKHTREPSIKSEQSYFTSTTATSDLAVDPVFSPSVAPTLKQEEDGQTPVVHSSAPHAVASASEVQLPSPRLAKSEDIIQVQSPSPDVPVDEEEEEERSEAQRHAIRVTAPALSTAMKRNSSSHKVAVKPALLSSNRDKAINSGATSSTKGSKSALQRTQSAKSVRIIESPTEADGAALEGTSNEESATGSTAAGPSTHSHQQHGKHAAKHSHSHSHAHIAPKRTMSSSRLKGHTRNGSSISLHKEARMKSPPLPPGNAAEKQPTQKHFKEAQSQLAVPPLASTTSAAPAPAIAVERPEMQAAPHVTKAIAIRRNNSSLANIIQTEPRSVSRGFAVPGEEDMPSQAPTASSPPVPLEVTSAVPQSAPDVPALHPPPPSPASPVVMIPSSVILPPQPRSSPADPRFRVHSTIRRPPSPPLEEDEPKYEEETKIVRTQSSASRTAMQRQEQAQQQQKQAERAPKRAETAPPNAYATAPRDMKPEPQQLTNAKKKQMFFFSSPGTDSDDEHSTSLKRPGLTAALPPPPPTIAEKPTSPQKRGQRGAILSEKDESSARPAIKVVQVTTPTEENASNAKQGGHASDDDDYEDEDDSDWSSEASESEEDEHQAAIRREEERQRLMFAKRTPSMVATQGGLLSKMLRPEEYSRGFANMPGHLRDNKSAMHLNQLPNIGGTAGIERARAANTLLTVTGLQASKSTAALPDLKAAETSRLVPTKSGNHLTRLGGAPSGVELESDDEDEDQSVQELSPTQQKKLAALMQRTTSAPGKSRTAPQQQEAPQAQVTRVTSAAQIAMQPEMPPANIFTPRTTRRNMLATELTESLRASLLAERSRSRPAAGIGRIVNAVGSRLGVRTQADSAPSQIEAPVPAPPRIQRGSTGFTPAHLSSNGASRPSNNRAATARLPNTRANSDPPQQTDYYSPGFHHTGW